jgi:hypothetical protein
VVVKKHATFRYLFDRTKPFERYPMIDWGAIFLVH